MRKLALLAGGFSALLLVGCPEEEERICTDHQPPAGFDAMNPPVSFSGAVVPILNRSCAFSDCHDAVSRNGLALGDRPLGAATVHPKLVGRPARVLPSMSYVTAGNPRESFLMHKIDGSHCTLDARCENGNCGTSMPRTSDLLEESERDVIRRWIAQGAKND
jgi:hypothetical protein